MKQTISLMEHQERKAEEEQHKREVVNLKPDYRKKVEVSSLSKINEIPQTQEGIFTYREQSGEPNFMVEGEIFSLDLSKKKVSYLLKIEIFDDTDSICVNKWVRENELQAAEALKIGDIVNVQGKAEYNTFQHEVTIQASSLNFVSHADHKSSRTDNAQVKRVELHMHTKMSNLDGLNEAADIVKTVTSWGHKAIAFTDRNGVYAIPDINHATEKILILSQYMVVSLIILMIIIGILPMMRLILYLKMQLMLYLILKQQALVKPMMKSLKLVLIRLRVVLLVKHLVLSLIQEGLFLIK